MYQRSPLTFGLIVASVLVTVAAHFYPSIEDYLWFSPWFLDESGALHDPGFEAIRNGEVWRLLTPIFIHMGIIHLVLNMMAMRVLGERVEIRKGTWRFALIGLVAAIGGNVGQFYHSGGAFGGMSGVVFALAGYLWIKGHTDPTDGLSLDQRNVNLMLGWFLLGIVAPLHMANVAHGVGLGVGMVFGLLRF
jgi:GlpG protein